MNLMPAIPVMPCKGCGGTIWRWERWFQCPDCGGVSAAYGGFFHNISPDGSPCKVDIDFINAINAAKACVAQQKKGE